MSWVRGRPAEAIIRSTLGGPCRVRTKEASAVAVDPAVRLDGQGDSVMVFES